MQEKAPIIYKTNHILLAENTETKENKKLPMKRKKRSLLNISKKVILNLLKN